MPADTKASAYHWYMDVEDAVRIVRWVWTPEGEFISSMTVGLMTLETKNEGTGEWSAPRPELRPEVPWVVAQNIARREGFAVEVAIYG